MCTQIKVLPVVARLNPEPALKCSAERIGACKTNGGGYVVDGLRPGAEVLARLPQPRIFDECRRRVAKCIFEPAAEMARAHAGTLRQGAYREVVT